MRINMKKTFNYLLIMTLWISTFLILPSAAQVKEETQIVASNTAQGEWDRLFNWSLNYSVDPEQLRLFEGESGAAKYTISVSQNSYKDTYRVEGKVTVTNGSGAATQGLTITSQVQYKIGSDPFQDIPYAKQTLVIQEQLKPQELKRYPYRVEFTPIPNATYRNVSRVTITNYKGYYDRAYGPELFANFTIPSTAKAVNSQITVIDSNGQSFPFESSTAKTYYKSYTCSADQGLHVNTATIKETGQKSNASLVVGCSVKGAAPQDIYYWAVYSGLSGRPDQISVHLPIWLGDAWKEKSLKIENVPQAVGVLQMKAYGSIDNSITRLYAQLLAAKLNISNGSYSSPIEDLLLEVDSFLAAYNYKDWEVLSKSQQYQVIRWTLDIEKYNTGAKL
jgi:hypothetical protein